MQPVYIRFGGYQPPTSVHNQAAVALGRGLAARLGPAVSFELDGNIIDHVLFLGQLSGGTRAGICPARPAVYHQRS
jgi:hypothetical protein